MDEDERVRLARAGLQQLDHLEDFSLREAAESKIKDTVNGVTEAAMLKAARMLMPRAKAAAATARATDSTVRALGLSHLEGNPRELEKALDHVIREEERVRFDTQLKMALLDNERAIADAKAKRDTSMLNASRGEVHAIARGARQTFPGLSKQFATLVFACAELLEALEAHGEGSRTLTKEELHHKAALLQKISALLAPHAAESLDGFVKHILRAAEASTVHLQSK